jgi:hypothetical protein
VSSPGEPPDWRSQHGDTVVSVERVINAPAADIFAIVADASRHPEIDGSESVKRLKQGAPEPLALGTTFGMSLKLGVRPEGKQTEDAMTKTLERLAEITESPPREPRMTNAHRP